MIPNLSMRLLRCLRFFVPEDEYHQRDKYGNQHDKPHARVSCSLGSDNATHGFYDGSTNDRADQAREIEAGEYGIARAAARIQRNELHGQRLDERTGRTQAAG